MKTICISAKCSDMFSANLNQDGKEIGFYSGYVPDFFPEQHYGDYVIFNIDVDTGRIVNWKKPTAKDLKIFTKELVDN